MNPRSLHRRPGVQALFALTVAALAGLVFVLAYFQPQKIFIDDTVSEAFPSVLNPAAVAASTSPTAPARGASSVSAPISTGVPPPTTVSAPTTVPALPAQPVVQARGSFVGVEHDTAGSALLITQPDGSLVLRLEDLDTSNGPDLRVLLSPTDSATAAYDDGAIELGRLKGNKGSQNYEIPAGTQLSAFRSAVIWCERFSVAFGIADLQPAQ